MKTHIMSLFVLCVPFATCANGDENWTPAAQDTLKKIASLKLESFEVNDDAYTAFEKMKALMLAKGINVQLHKVKLSDFKDADMPTVEAPSHVEIRLKNVPLDVVMKYFDAMSRWGWVLNDDGSIIYVDQLCACGYPKNGIKHPEQGGADQPTTVRELKSKGKDKPQPESKVAPR